jgi:hypothetical protein
MDGVSRPSHSNTLAGWREWVQLPEIGVPWIKAKLDTGAQTSSIHAYDIEEFARDGQEWVRFRVRPWQKSVEDQVEVELPVHDRRVVRSSNGQSEERVVVKMPIELVGRRVSVLVTLTNRDHMGFRMLVGREALKHGFDVTSSRSYLGERAPKHARRKNRGRAA